MPTHESAGEAPAVSALPALGVVARSLLRRLHVVPRSDPREQERRERAEREARIRRSGGKRRR